MEDDSEFLDDIYYGEEDFSDESPIESEGSFSADED